MSSHSQNSGGGQIVAAAATATLTSTASPLNIAKSYVYQPDHGLIDDRRLQDDHEAEEVSEDEGDEDEDDESEGAFTRFHRFCWALCCTTCCCYCCEKGPINEEVTSLRSSRSSSLRDDIDKGDSSRCLSSLVVVLREKFMWMRDRLEFAEYGNGHHVMCEPYQYFRVALLLTTTL